MMFCKSLLFVISLLFILIGLGLANVLRELTEEERLEKDSFGSQEENSTKSVFGNILNVNQETGNLMRPNASGDENELFEADIRLHARTHAIVFGAKSRRQFGSTGDLSILWPGQKISYTIDNTIASERNQLTYKVIKAAMAEIEQKTCIRFKGRTTERHYLHFIKESGCWSLVGRVGGKQQISIGYDCEEKGIAVHEIMHALGFWHEQSRPDRDTYIEIMDDNVKDGYENQFQKYDTGDINSRGSPYDYSSVMHYNAYAFSKNGMTTVRIRNSRIKVTLGQRKGLSETDVNQINSLYKCKVDPIHGKWGAWSGWSQCTKQCDGGTRKRSRSCNNPEPKNGGNPCPGETLEEIFCNKQACSVDCNFDSNMCLWQNVPGDDFDWTRKSGATPSQKTGPTADHTRRDNKGYYMFIEASSPRKHKDTAKLQGPILSEKQHPRCFRFWYHMRGAFIERLEIILKSGRGSRILWALKRHKGNEWKSGHVAVPPLTGNFKIVIAGYRGRDYRGDISIDDISMTQGGCVISPPNAKPPTPVTSKPSTATVTSTTITPSTTALPKRLLSCDFETNCNVWKNTNIKDTFDWIIYQGGTPSVGTGPLGDHSKGGTGHYIYLEASKPNVAGDKARVISNNISASPYGQRCLQFHYHMYGRSIGSLKVFIKEAAAKEKMLWFLEGEQRNTWLPAQVPLSSSKKYQIIIEGVIGNGYLSDIGIDDIGVVNGGCNFFPPDADMSKKPTSKPTVIPTSAPISKGFIRLEVKAEGCDDPTVRQKTLQKLGITRVRRDAQSGYYIVLKPYQANQQGGKKGRDQPKLGRRNQRPSMNKGSSAKDGIAQSFGNDCLLARSSIKVNGKEYSTRRPGHNFVVINARNGKVVDRVSFDTNVDFWSGLALNRYVSKIPDESIVAIATQDSASGTWFGESALRGLGAVDPYFPNYRGSWVFIGYKGKKSINWIKQRSKGKGQGPSMTTADIPLQGVGRTDKVFEGAGTNKVRKVITILNSVTFAGDSFLPIPVKFSNMLDFGKTDFTLSAWIKTSEDGTIISKTGSGKSFDPNIKHIYIDKGYINVRLGRSFNGKGASRVDDNKWHHIALVVKGKQKPHSITQYSDGKIEILSGLIPVADPSGYLAKVGFTVKNYPIKSSFKGNMRKVVYYTNALTKGEIMKLLNDRPSV